MTEVKVNVDEKGNMIMETTGFKGAACLRELDEISEKMKEYGIGSTVKDQKKKSEYYVAAQKSGILNRSQ